MRWSEGGRAKGRRAKPCRSQFVDVLSQRRRHRSLSKPLERVARCYRMSGPCSRVWLVGLLGSFVKFKVEFTAGSGDLSESEEGQFVETRSVAPETPVGYYSQHIFEMKNYSGAYTTRERGMYGIHWINLTAGELDRTWTAADYSAVEGAQETLWTSLAALISNECRLVEHRWYAYGVSVTPPNPPSRITTIGAPKVGTSTQGWVRQTGGTITLRTTLRRHWGRIYFPMANNLWTTGGQASSSDVDSVAAAARTALMVTPNAQGVVPVVWDRNRKILFGVTQLEMDSVPDIQRRRRPRDTGYKKIYSA